MSRETGDVDGSPELLNRLHEEGVVDRVAAILARCAIHVHPLIVNRVQEANLDLRKRWDEVRGPAGIDVESYLFEGSACVFPGARRMAGRDENRLRPKRRFWTGLGRARDEAAVLDDNILPRNLWTFLHGVRVFDGKRWKESGLGAYELAHVFSHKSSECEDDREMFAEHGTNRGSEAVLFTCATNVVLLPKGLVKPTDQLQAIKQVFYQRSIDLYGEAFLPGWRGFKRSLVPPWASDLKWGAPYLPEGWRERLDALLVYREGWLRKRFRMESPKQK